MPEVSEQLQVVRRYQRRDPELIEAFEQRHDLTRQYRVEIAGGLIRQQDGGPVDDRASDSHALLLTSRERQRKNSLLPEQPDLIQRGPDPSRNLRMPQAVDHQGERNVVEDGSVQQQLWVLEDDADLAPIPGDLASPDSAQILAADDDLSPRTSFHERNETQQRGFAGAGVSGEKNHLTCSDVQLNVTQRLPSTRVSLAHAVELNHVPSVPFRGGANATEIRARQRSYGDSTSFDLLSREKSVDEVGGIELPQIINAFADPDETNGKS